MKLINTQTKFIVIIGLPIDHSLSPIFHNYLYQKLNLKEKYVYLASNLDPKNLELVVNSFRHLSNFYGLVCTIPHKTEILKYLDLIDPTAKKIGAVNTVIKEDNLLKGYNTDWLGIEIPFKKRNISLKNRLVAVLGAGGAARAVVFALKKNQTKIVILNRNLEKAKQLAKEFDCLGYYQLNNQEIIKNCSIIINTTPLGMKPFLEKTPIKENLLSKNQIVFDVIYTPLKTKLLKIAQKKGCLIIPGWEMFFYQAIEQFKIYTKTNPPENIAKKFLLKIVPKK